LILLVQEDGVLGGTSADRYRDQRTGIVWIDSVGRVVLLDLLGRGRNILSFAGKCLGLESKMPSKSPGFLFSS
jgi:hypothetical protein